MKTKKQKLMMLLCTFLLLVLAVPFYGKGIDADAAGKKAALVKKTVTGQYGVNNGMASIQLKNCNPKAKYSISLSPKNKVSISNFYLDEKNNGYFYLTSSIKTTVKATIKETVGKTTRKVGTCTVKFNKVVDSFEILSWDDENGITVEKGQTYNLAPCLYVGSKKGITYRSSNTSIATVNKYGVITAKKEGTATLTVKQGSKTCSVKLTVKPQTKTTSENKKLDQLKTKTEKLYNKKITKSNYTSWYNEYYELAKAWVKYTNYSNQLQVSGRYTISDCREKLAAFMKTRTSNSTYGASLDAVKISKLTSNRVTLQLAKAVSKADMVNILRGTKKYSKNAAADYTILLTRKDSKYSYTYIFTASVKEGQKTITGKLKAAYKFSNLTYKSITLPNKLTKGTAYDYVLYSAHNSGVSYSYHKGTIKCK